MTVVSDVQPWNVLYSILVTLVGIVIEVSDVHDSKAKDAMLVNEDGITTDDVEGQPKNEV